LWNYNGELICDCRQDRTR